MTLTNKLAAIAFTLVSGAASATCTTGCGTTPTTGTNNTNNTTVGVTANPTATNNTTVGVVANPTANAAANSAANAANNTTVGVVANPTANATGGNAANHTTVGVNAAGGNAAQQQAQQQAQQTAVQTNVAVDTKGTVGNITTAGGNSTANATVNTAGTVGNITTAGGTVKDSGNSASVSGATVKDSGNSTVTTAGTVATGAIQNANSYSNTTNYQAAAAGAYAATAQAPNTTGCVMSGRGFGLGVQVLAGGVSGNVSGKAEWNDDSAKCDVALAENMVIAKGGNPVDSTAALLTGAQKSPLIAAAVTGLTGAAGAKLLGLFQAAQAPVVVQQAAPVTAPASAPVYVTVHVANDKVTEVCANGKPKALNAKTGALECNM